MQAQEPARIENGIALDAQGNPIAGSAIAAFPVSHALREKSYDDREARIIQGRMWLVSFTDLFSILLCFFILMYSMKDPDMDRIAKVVGASDGGLYGGVGTMRNGGDLAGVGIDRVEYGDGLDLSYLEGVLQRQVREAGVEKDVAIVTARDHLKIRIENPGGEKGAMVAHRLGERLGVLPNRIQVVGLPSSWSSGDWAGSLQSAMRFAAQMKDGGYRKRLDVLGEGETKGQGIEIRVEQDDGRIQ